jgi:hypothetical protein
LKLKSLAVITLLVLGCSAAFAQSGSFALGFLSYDKSVQYCDFEEVLYTIPFVAGIHNLTTGCGGEVDGAMTGLRGNTIPVGTQPVSGSVFNLADNTFDATYLAFTGCQIEWVTKKAASSHQFGWEFDFTCGGGGDYLGNYGYLTTQLGPDKNNGNNAAKSSFGSARTNAKHKL